jgi:hypothetical protein
VHVAPAAPPPEVLPGWSHGTEAAGPTTLAALASCPANNSVLAPLPKSGTVERAFGARQLGLQQHLR